MDGTPGQAADAQTRVTDAIEKLLQSIDRPGDFCVHGQRLAALPRLRVQGAGALSFPVPEDQIRALIGAAEPAPYGKGTETVVDRSVRNCWQIGPERVRLAGAAWPETFADILETAAVGLGCAPDRVDARLHRLLIYEPGGFFAPHRDTEKADGMIATLSVSLPTAGAGGELVVRHRDRERTLDMTTGEPSQLTFAAFYADCTHEVRPVTEGHRVTLVFNLCLRPGDDESPREAPDYSAQVERLAERLPEWFARGGTDKLVWLLEHDYSEAGLSFDGLKNADAAVARVLTEAAERVACEVHAAVVHIEQYGGADYTGRGWDWGDGEDEDEWEMGDVVDSREWLDGWARPDGRRPRLGEVELLPGELLPRGALDDAAPDEQRVHEASGNEGVSVERAYHRAALVVWPRSKALEIVARSDMAGAVALVADELDRRHDTRSGRPRQLLSRLIDIWPTGPYDEDAQARALALRLLHSTGDENRAARYLRKVVLKRYDGSENEPLALVVDMIGPSAARPFLTELPAAHLRRRPTAMLALVRCLDETRDESSRGAWNRVLQAAVRAILRTLPAALPPARRRSFEPTLQAPERFGVEAVDDLFTLACRWGSTAEATAAAEAVAGRPQVVTPDRTLPAVLARLHGEAGAAATGAFALLWRHAAHFLLARSARPPEEPRDWTIDGDTGCRCEHCRRLRDFCRDPAARVARFPLRKDLRAHLHQAIDRRGLDIEHVTERRGRPFTLECTKTRASHRRRLAEYADDISCMRDLIRAAPSGGQAAPCAPDLARLHEAVTASGR